MKIGMRILAVVVATLAVACGGGSSGGSGDNVAGAVGVNPNDGDYAGIGTFLTNLSVVDLSANTAPAVADCVGDISIVVDSNAADVITGSGECNLPANFVTYTLVGGFINATEFEGDISLVLNGRTNDLNFAGSRNGDVLEASFAGRTPVTARLVIDWDGNFTAER